jgi:hypothetical protein
MTCGLGELADPEQFMALPHVTVLLARCDSQPCALCLLLFREEGFHEVHLYVDPMFRGMVGIAAIAAFKRWGREHLNAKNVWTWIKEDTDRRRRGFIRGVGFVSAFVRDGLEWLFCPLKGGS